MVNTKKLLDCAMYSATIYEDKIKNENLITRHEIDDIAFCIFKEDNTFYLTFRGSDNKSNWLSNFTYLKTFDDRLGVYIHKGYKRASKKLFEYLNDLFLNKVFKNFDFVFTGHSLGGAMAIILGLYFSDLGLNVKDIITFGSPKITNSKGAKKLSNKYIVKSRGLKRIINDKDLVNLLPPNSLLGWWRGRYQHLGEEIILLDDGKIDINTYDKVLNNNKSLFFNIDSNSIKEHRIINYIRKLLKIQKGFRIEKNTFKK